MYNLDDSDEYIRTLLKANENFKQIAIQVEENTLLSIISKIIRKIAKTGMKVISIVGGAASGKSTLASKLVQVLDNASSISTDDFVIGDREYRRKYLEGNNPFAKYNFDLLQAKVDALKAISTDGVVYFPFYDEQTGTGLPPEGNMIDAEHLKRAIHKKQYLIVEGDFRPVKDDDYLIYFHVPDSIRLKNRIRRDISCRGETHIDAIVDNFADRQKTQHFRYTLPCAQSANILIVATVVATDALYQYDVYRCNKNTC